MGQLLVDAGLLSQANLELALAEQKQTQSPLGRILVERGFVATPTIANALAEQHGGILKTEYGFATGLRSKSIRAGVGDTSLPAPLLPPPISPVRPGLKPWGEDDDRPLPRLEAPPSTDRPDTTADSPPPGPVHDDPPALPSEPPADPAVALLLALNDDDSIEQVEAAVTALRLALASAARERAALSYEEAQEARIAELEAELAAIRAARAETVAAPE